VAFEWMLGEAMGAGLLVDATRLAQVRTRSPASVPWAEPQHESLTGKWWLAEVVPKLVYDRATKRRAPRMGLGRHRQIEFGERLDRSVLERMQHTSYAPPNLSRPFVEKVRAMSAPPTTLPYIA
jgi:hypothetical protein